MPPFEHPQHAPLCPRRPTRRDGCYISKGYDATSHFETEINDVLDMYRRITGGWVVGGSVDGWAGRRVAGWAGGWMGGRVAGWPGGGWVGGCCYRALVALL